MTDPTGQALNKQSSASLSTLAARVLQGYQPTREETRSLAASVLSQDTTKGQGKGRRVTTAAIKASALPSVVECPVCGTGTCRHVESVTDAYERTYVRCGVNGRPATDCDGNTAPKARKVRVLAIIENNDHEDDGA